MGSRLWLVTVWFLIILFAAPSALADSAVPTTYRSQVTELEPAVDGVAVEVVGGDAFLRIEVTEGTEVEVPGYEGEPYLRIQESGEVEVNRNSPTYWANEDRYARVPVPAGVSAEEPPRWETVAEAGSYGWHDHRTHWMSPEPPPAVDRSTRSHIMDWRVPIVVGGQQVDVHGVLEWVPSVSPVPWALAALAVAFGTAWLGRARWAVASGGLLAAAVGLSQALASPLGLWEEALLWVPPVTAALVALAPVGGPSLRRLLLWVGIALLGVWAVLRVSSLWMPVLPSPLPEAVERAVVSAVTGAGVGALVVAYRRASRST